MMLKRLTVFLGLTAFFLLAAGVAAPTARADEAGVSEPAPSIGAPAAKHNPPRPKPTPGPREGGDND